MRVFLFFLLISSSEQLNCLTNSFQKFQFSTFPLDRANIENKINNQISTVEGITWCQVQLIMKYNEQLLEIVSIPLFSTDYFNFTLFSNPKVIITFTLDHNNPSIVGKLSHSCDFKDNCDRDFVFSRYLPLISQNYTHLHFRLTELLVKEKTLPTKCIDTLSIQPTVICHNKICAAKFTTISLYISFQTNYYGDCTDSDEQSTIVEITTTLFRKPLDIHQTVYYTCMFNECNDNLTKTNVYNIVLASFEVHNITHGFYVKLPDVSTTISYSFINSTTTTNPTTTFTNSATKIHCIFSYSIKTILSLYFLFISL